MKIRNAVKLGVAPPITLSGNCKSGGSVAELCSARGREAPSMSAKGTHTEPPHIKLKVIVSNSKPTPSKPKKNT